MEKKERERREERGERRQRERERESWALVAHVYNPSYSGGEIRKIKVRSQKK
jgi:hypothetical protein